MRFTTAGLRIFIAFSLSSYCLFAPIRSVAAQAPPDAGQTVDSQQSAPTVDSTVAKEERGSLVVAPLPIVSPAIGNGIVPVVAYIFPF